MFSLYAHVYTCASTCDREIQSDVRCTRCRKDSVSFSLGETRSELVKLQTPGLLLSPSRSGMFPGSTDDWNKMVGSWVSSSYVVGQTYRFNEEYYAPALGNTPFAMAVSRRIAGFTACTGSDARCVKLVLTATVSGEDFRSAMRQFLEETVGEPVNVKHISVVKKIEVIAEPGTLIPHRTRSSEETTVTIEDSKGNTRTSRDTKDTRVTYSYESYRASN